MGQAEQTTAGLPLIVVMPDIALHSDGGGWCTDWPDGKEKWETFHIDQLIPWVDANLPTVAARRGRAVYGLSQGGFGAMSYAARHPDLFAAAGSYSGAIDTAADPTAQLLVTPIVQGTAFGLDRQPADAMFGPRTTNEINWAAHDPATLAANLRGMDIRLYTGNGRPGPLDAGFPNPGAMAIESGVHELTQLFHARLERLGIPSAYRDYGPGTHSWAYWARDLRDTIAPLMETFGHPRPDPVTVDYRSAEDPWSAWGWDVDVHRPAREFSALQDAGRDGFALRGSGTADVVTAPLYPAGATATVHITGLQVDRTETATADGAGRLHLTVPLGPGNRARQDTLQARLAGGTKAYTTQVRVTDVRAPVAAAGRRRCRPHAQARRGARRQGLKRSASRCWTSTMRPGRSR
jgi:S-formylglutathione hydrolase FrmB